MKIFNFINRLRAKQSVSLTEDFHCKVKQVILNIENSKKTLDDDAFGKIIQEICSTDFEAEETYIFLPIIFTRLLLPEINWDNTYYENDSLGNETEKRYDTTEAYKIILEVSSEYFHNNPAKETILQIVIRSAEFNAINQLLSDGGKIENIKLTKTRIIR